MPAPAPPPEARLIAEARAALFPRLSMRQASLRAGISETRWRQIESGRIRIRGEDYPEVAPADTLARMAQVVGLKPDDLARVGRLNAAAALAELQKRDRVRDGRAREEAARLAALVPGLSDKARRQLAERIALDIEAARTGEMLKAQ